MTLKILSLLACGLAVCVAVGFLLLAIMALSARLMRWRFGEIPPETPHAEYRSHQSGVYAPRLEQDGSAFSRFMHFALSTVMVPVIFSVAPIGLILLVVLLMKPQWLIR